MLVTPTNAQIAAGVAAGRKALNDYSEFDSRMVPDDALETFVRKVLDAALNVAPPQPKKDYHA